MEGSELFGCVRRRESVKGTVEAGSPGPHDQHLGVSSSSLFFSTDALRSLCEVPAPSVTHFVPCGGGKHA